MKNIIFFGLLLLSVGALAADGGGEHHAEGVPVKLVTYQAINMAIIVIGLIYFLKDGVRKAFKERQASYLVAAQKAEAARKEAEDQRLMMMQKISHIENTATESVARARAEAVDMKNQIINEAKSLSQRIKSEAEQSAQAEILRAKKEIRESIIKQAMDLTKDQVEKQVSAADHERLQSNFIQNIQVVQK